MVNRLVTITAGDIRIDDTSVRALDVNSLRRGIGYVIQSIGLMPHRTVEQNIGTIPNLIGWDDHRIRERVGELAGIFDLDPELLPRYPSELSGGQRQRVGVARALAADPPVMLMDEPFAAVDPIIRARLQDQFLDIQRELRKTIVFVTHDIDEAIKMADRIAILNRGAKVEQYAPPEEILRVPASDFVEDFVGAERGLKRLALIPVSAIDVETGPVVAPTASADEARRTVREGGLGWVSVVADGELLGWIDESSLDGARTAADAGPRKFSAYVTVDDSLRTALDSIVTSSTNVAVVVTEGQRYLGILTLDKLSREVTQ
jgi:osmoprotectant transport system ATP-binding protein